MKKNFILLSLLLLLFIVTPLTAWALAPSETRTIEGEFILPPRPGQSDLNILGQNHSYSVLLRGNGEAIVTARFIFSNLAEKTQTNYRLRIPRIDPRDIVVYQQIRKTACLRYQNPIPIFMDPTIPDSGAEPCFAYTNERDCQLNSLQVAPNCYWRPDAADSCRSTPPQPEKVIREKICIQYDEPDYFNFYDYGNIEYKKLEYLQLGDEIDITLKNPVKPQKTGALLLSFRAFGYAKKNILGGYNFAFETVKIPDKIYNLQVGISVDSDLLLRQDTGRINYYPESGSGVSMMAPMMEKGAVSSSQLNDYYNQVGVGAVTKTASNLQPSESFSVKGSYGYKSYQLYSREIFLGLAAVLVISLLIYVAAKYFIRFYRKLISKSVYPQKAVRAKKVASEAGLLPVPAAIPLIESVAVSFVSSFIIFGTALFYFFVFPVIRYNIFVGSSSYNFYDLQPLQALISIVVIIVLTLFDLAVITGAVSLLWKRRGHLWGIITIILNIFWLVLYLIILLVILMIFSSRTGYYDYPTPIPMRTNPSVIQPEMMKDSPAQ